MLMLLYDSLSVVVSRVKLWTVTGPQLRSKAVESFALQQLDCVKLDTHCCTDLLKVKIVVSDAFTASKFVEIVRYPSNIVHRISLHA